MKDRTVKQVQCGSEVLVGRERVNEDQGEGIWLVDFIYLWENRTKKPLVIALSGQGGGQEGGNQGGEMAGRSNQCKSIQNSHNESSLNNEYILI
jgi:hypothetical protein